METSLSEYFNFSRFSEMSRKNAVDGGMPQIGENERVSAQKQNARRLVEIRFNRSGRVLPEKKNALA